MTTPPTRGAAEPAALLIDYRGVLTASVVEAFSGASRHECGSIHGSEP